nr:hypothetical protein Iba_chr04cCG17150 [Ipomoea batatas]
MLDQRACETESYYLLQRDGMTLRTFKLLSKKERPRCAGASFAYLAAQHHASLVRAQWQLSQQQRYGDSVPFLELCIRIPAWPLVGRVIDIFRVKRVGLCCKSVDHRRAVKPLQIVASVLPVLFLRSQTANNSS